MRHASAWLVLLAFMAIAAVFLLGEHQAHLWSVVPWLLLLACPLLHLFRHGRHGGHAGHQDRRGPGGGGDVRRS